MCVCICVYVCVCMFSSKKDAKKFWKQGKEVSKESLKGKSQQEDTDWEHRTVNNGLISMEGLEESVGVYLSTGTSCSWSVRFVCWRGAEGWCSGHRLSQWDCLASSRPATSDDSHRWTGFGPSDWYTNITQTWTHREHRNTQVRCQNKIKSKLDNTHSSPYLTWWPY